LVYEDGRWRVKGPGKERARVAYANLAGDQVTYSFADQEHSPCRGGRFPGSCSAHDESVF